MRIAILAVFLAACSFDAADIESWPGVAGGPARLAGYVADPVRPMDLRLRAARALVRHDDFDLLTAVLDRVNEGDREALGTDLAVFARETLTSEEPVVRWRAVTLAYLLLEQPAFLGAEAESLAVNLADRCLKDLGIKDFPGSVAPEIALLGAMVARPEDVLPRVVNAATTAEKDDDFLDLIELMAQLKEPVVEANSGVLLLNRARARFPAISPGLAASLKNNNSEAGLLYLVELIGEARLPGPVRDMGLDAAFRLGPKALPGLLRALSAETPADDLYRWEALVSAWAKGGPERLADILRALPEGGQWPAAGTELKDAIEGFCDNRLGEKAPEVRPVLLELLSDPHWVARAFAMACVTRLYAVDAPTLLKPLANDLTALPGWSPEITTFAAAVAALGK